MMLFSFFSLLCKDYCDRFGNAKISGLKFGLGGEWQLCVRLTTLGKIL